MFFISILKKKFKNFSVYFFLILFAKSAFFQETSKCEILSLISENTLLKNQSFNYTELFEKQNEQQKIGYKINSNYAFRVNCLTKSSNFLLERITIVDYNHHSQRRILNSKIYNVLDDNHETVFVWYADVNSNKNEILLNNEFECAYYEPIVCNRTFPLNFIDEHFEVNKKMPQKQNLKPLMWILATVGFVSVTIILIRLYNSIKTKKSQLSVRRIYKPNNLKSSNQRLHKSSLTKKESVKQAHELQEINNNHHLIDDVEIPIIFESSTENKIV